MNYPLYIYVAGYNCEKWVQKCLNSIAQQQYANYKLVVVNDASTDRTGEEIEGCLSKFSNVSYQLNTTNQKWLANAAQYLKPQDEDIVITIDLDDWLPHDRVFDYINKVYTQQHCWLTYGSYATASKPDQIKKHCRPFPDEILRRRAFRSHAYVTSHLRTFKGFLWNNLDPQTQFKDRDGNYADMAYDCAMMFPMLEMCRPGKIRCLKEILYIYNDGNPISDHRRSREQQKQTETWFRKQPKVEMLTR